MTTIDTRCHSPPFFFYYDSFLNTILFEIDQNLCLNKAKDSGIRTAKLPIGRYLASLPTRKVLTVNQVFEILIKWVETKDWEQSLYSVIPKRKFQQEGKSNLETNVDAAATVVDDDDVENEPVQPEDFTGL